jgi:hypothetical protein
LATSQASLSAYTQRHLKYFLEWARVNCVLDYQCSAERRWSADVDYGLQSQMAVVPIYDWIHSMSQMMKSYQSHGFVPVEFYPVNTFRQKQFGPEFDAIFNSLDGRLEWAP